MPKYNAFTEQLIKEGYKKTLEGWLSPYDGKKYTEQAIRQQRIREEIKKGIRPDPKRKRKQ